MKLFIEEISPVIDGAIWVNVNFKKVNIRIKQHTTNKILIKRNNNNQ